MCNLMYYVKWRIRFYTRLRKIHPRKEWMEFNIENDARGTYTHRYTHACVPTIDKEMNEAMSMRTCDRVSINRRCRTSVKSETNFTVLLYINTHSISPNLTNQNVLRCCFRSWSWLRCRFRLCWSRLCWLCWFGLLWCLRWLWLLLNNFVINITPLYILHPINSIFCTTSIYSKNALKRFSFIFF